MTECETIARTSRGQVVRRGGRARKVEMCHCLSALGQAVLFEVVTLIGTARPKAAEQWHVLWTSTEWHD